ncbi:MAG: hypothetical protein KDI04_02700 [Halieaceae bacterium]|nr:hypothetical protein [Halieaceae bacterium]
MAKLKPDPIGLADLNEYINQESDFAFELEVLKMLVDAGIPCEHGGHYEDPIEGKSREFDIRARFVEGACYVSMAIECKRIRENFPVLVSCVPRTPRESYHYVALSTPHGIDGPPAYQQAEGYNAGATLHGVKLLRGRSIYASREYVGKSTSQVGRDANGITANDSGLFEKWGQCVASSHDLIGEIHLRAANDRHEQVTAVIPIVVVPNNRLWVVKYDSGGNIQQEPQLVNRISVFAGKRMTMASNQGTMPFWISHTEFMTINGLEEFVEDQLKGPGAMENLFGL